MGLWVIKELRGYTSAALKILWAKDTVLWSSRRILDVETVLRGDPTKRRISFSGGFLYFSSSPWFFFSLILCPALIASPVAHWQINKDRTCVCSSQAKSRRWNVKLRSSRPCRRTWEDCRSSWSTRRRHSRRRKATTSSFGSKKRIFTHRWGPTRHLIIDFSFFGGNFLFRFISRPSAGSGWKGAVFQTGPLAVQKSFSN